MATFPVLEFITWYWTRFTGPDITPMNPIFIGTVLPEGFIVSLVIFKFLHVPPSHDGCEAPAATETGANSNNPNTKKAAIFSILSIIRQTRIYLLRTRLNIFKEYSKKFMA